MARLIWMRVFVSFLIWSPVAASGAAPTCVVKLKVNSDDKSESATYAYAEQILNDQGYKIISDWLFRILSHSDYDVKIIITHTVFPNYGFPVSTMWIQLFVADSSGRVLVDGYVDRAYLGDDLRASIPTCHTSQSSGPLRSRMLSVDLAMLSSLEQR